MKSSPFWPSPLDAHNTQLGALVRPDGWENPDPAGVYNLLVVGAGTAGLISAAIAASLGAKVALVEKRLMGGDCLNSGCIPSKTLIRSARAMDQWRKAASFGLPEFAPPTADFAAVMERVRGIRARVAHADAAERYRAMGVDVFFGEGRFTGPRSLEVAGQSLRFAKAVIATGAKAVTPSIPGIDTVEYLTNDSLFELTAQPEHLVIIGGGPIGCEMAQAFRRLGSQVTIVQSSRFLPHEDPEASAALAGVFQHEGIEVLLDAKVLEASRGSGDTKQLLVAHNGSERRITGDALLVGAGRAAEVRGMGLELAGVEYDAHKGILVDDFLRTRNARIYAAGDCCMAWKFTHAAEAAAQIVVQNALFMGRKRLSRLLMPWCTYTDPEIAHVGMYEKDAAVKGVAVDSFKFSMAENDRAVTDGETQGFVKIMVKKGTDRILGATIVAAHAGEMINEITAVMVAGAGLNVLGRVIHPYPTQAEAIKRTAWLHKKSRLTPWVRSLLNKWLRWSRLIAGDR